MKNIRRSLNKERSSAHSKQASTSAAPPKLVIKAIESYTAQGPKELSFNAGDFFHVMSAEGGDHFFDASNPLENARGLVPVSHFQVLGRNVRESNATSNGNVKAALFGRSGASSTVTSPQSTAPSVLPSQPATSPPGVAAVGAATGGAPRKRSSGAKPLYGIVQYDFVAERADELDAKRGEPIIVIAQSNHEWFVAKPIGRLGGPGLIPVSFVEVQDLATGKPIENVEDLIKSSVVPRVEEWKKMTAEYKNSSIPLGRFDFGASSSRTDKALPATGHEGESMHTGEGGGPSEVYSYAKERKQFGLVTTASVESFHQEEGSYWFHLKVFFSTGATLILYRLYQDFYDFQIALMDDYPVEAGRVPPPGETQTRRILPMMPGPTEYEDEVVCSQRVHDLSIYLGELCDLPAYIRMSGLMYEFLVPRAGDVEVEVGNMQGDVLHADVIALLDGHNQNASHLGHDGHGRNTSDRLNSIEGQYDELVRYLERDGPGDAASAGPDGRSSGVDGLRSGLDGLHLGNSTGTSRTSLSRAADGSTSVHKEGTPANSAAGFIKIKIVDTKTNDLIAIRVPPYVTLDALLEKVRERLGKDVRELCYRLADGETAGGSISGGGLNPSSGTLIPLATDSLWHDYLASTTRYMLHAF